MKISLLEQREIEARMTAAIVDRLAESIGRDQALAITGQAARDLAGQAGRDLRRQTGVGTLEALAQAARHIWARDGALTIDFLEISPTVLRFNVTRCRYAERYARMDVGELGYYLSCARDAAFARGFNPDIRLTPTRTIMQGAAFCDFRFELAP